MFVKNNDKAYEALRCIDANLSYGRVLVDQNLLEGDGNLLSVQVFIGNSKDPIFGNKCSIHVSLLNFKPSIVLPDHNPLMYEEELIDYMEALKCIKQTLEEISESWIYFNQLKDSQGM